MGVRIDTYSQLLLFLRQGGYVEVDQIHQSGDFHVLGDTIVVWPVTLLEPRRLHFFGEELEKTEKRVGERWESSGAVDGWLPNNLATEHGTIKPGEYIVHPFHGVGIFERIISRAGQDQSPVQYVSLQYAGNDRLLYPLEKQADLMPYIGSRHPRLTRLYSKSWQNTKERVQKDLIKVARELLKIYAARQLSERTPYESSPAWEEVLDTSAGFTLTEDQVRCLHEIKHDFELSKHPMDRLVCGDVGFGKTEVALRAAAEVMANGKQVAFIAPTTVLVEQHYELLKKRYEGLPVRVEHVSRLTAGREKEILGKLESGQLDIVVGTHRLLGKDVRWRELGLLILDEEQKFGVAQKERLKDLRPTIDVLSLSATPIPRTLSMSLSGLRSLSILRTAPTGRKPVETEIGAYSDARLAKALATELKRGGQAYVVHNRVLSLHLVERRVREQLEKSGLATRGFDPNSPLKKEEGTVVVAIAHGQMGEISLARTMAAFMAGEIDVLVASSIVEHGLDSPGANTLVVLHSEWFGLSDLYQLRGRVGRRMQQAHAYFMIGGIERTPEEQVVDPVKVGETARKRLEALKEADQLGSGWSIALRDLEIRGGGNILGHEQHGSMEAIGLLLYAQLLQEEIGRQARRQGIALFQKSEG